MIVSTLRTYNTHATDQVLTANRPLPQNFNRGQLSTLKDNLQTALKQFKEAANKGTKQEGLTIVEFMA